jgi:hypothetical protein
MLSHTEKIIVRDSHGTTIIIDGKPYKQIAIVLSSNPDIKPDEATGHNRRLVACWKDHDGLVHDNARLYLSVQGEMQGRLKAEQERDEALDVLRNLAAWANKYTAGDHIFHLDELNGAVVEAKAILTKHKVNHDQE